MAVPIIPLPGTNPKTFARFMAKVQVAEGCWEWTGCLSNYGYGIQRVNGKTVQAHRLAHQLFVGPIPAGLYVCHHCDNRRCVNALGGHLFVGTASDNNHDRDRKGRGNVASGVRHGTRTHPESVAKGDGHWTRVEPWRMARGERSPHAKLTALDVQHIRALARTGRSQREIGRLYGVSREAARAIIHRRAWGHVP